MIILVFAVAWLVSLGLVVGITLGVVRDRKPAAASPVPESVFTPVPLVPDLTLQAQECASAEPEMAELQLHRDLQIRLGQSIVGQLRSTTDPLSANLLEIRSDLVDLTQKVRAHEQISSGDEDRDRLQTEAAAVKTDMAEAARLTRETNQSMAGHFRALKMTLKTILEVNDQVSDLSDRINVLSINASIEAARAGNAGRGFKVIANQVKSLALETSTFLAQVRTSLQGAEALFDRVDRDLEGKGTSVEALLLKQDTSFVSLQDNYRQQGQRFSQLCRTIEGFVGRLDLQVDRLSPLVQLHEVTVQELENLNLVFARVLDQVLTPWERSQPDPTQVRAWGTLVREHLTTAGELAVLDAVMAAWGCPGSAEAPQIAGSVELF